MKADTSNQEHHGDFSKVNASIPKGLGVKQKDLLLLVWFIYLTAYQFLMSYLILKFDTNNLHTVI